VSKFNKFFQISEVCFVSVEVLNLNMSVGLLSQLWNKYPSSAS